MELYRIAKSVYAHDLSGTGAGLYGGRWNPAGLNMVYTAGSISLASLEYLAHNFHLIASQSMTLSILQTPEGAPIQEVSIKDLPKDWNSKLQDSKATQQIGVDFLRQSDYYLLKVPSVIVPLEFNYLLNPMHLLHGQTTIIDKIESFELDRRLLGR